MENVDVARVLAELADLLEIGGENAFKIRALRSAALTIENLTERLESMAEAGTLESIPGVGEGIATRILEILKTGTTHDRTALAAKLPVGLLEVMRIEGVGPKTAKLLHDELQVSDVASLEAAARAGRIRELKGMGAKKEERILHGIEGYRGRIGRFTIQVAYPTALSMVERLKSLPSVERVEIAGSMRRRRETVGDLDLLAIAPDSRPVISSFVSSSSVVEVLAQGETKASVRLQNGIQMDLRVVPEESFGAALHYFTGSKEHNVAIRDRAKRMGLRVNEYGVFREDGSTERLGGAEEADVFSAVNLPWIPPEIRENRGEIEAALKGELPALVDLSDIRGDVHMHTRETDGASTIEEMVEAARARGYRYVAITDHSKAVSVARGMDEARLSAQMKLVDAVDARQRGGFRVFKGIEVDILGDGALDMDRSLLADLDVVIASVHSRMNQPKEEMTGRILRALESGVVDILGHPTGRILGRRDPFEVDVERVLEAAAHLGVAMEINAYPDRLDLKDIHCRQAKSLGVKIVISTDSHSPRHLENMMFGVHTARRGWLEKSDVQNTLEPDAFLAALHPAKRRRRA